MIIGSGLLARKFAPRYSGREDICIYAAGVSNSSCRDLREFERERSLLATGLEKHGNAQAFVYFGTCSVGDPDSLETPYVQHKLAMERLVEAHPGHLILRLSQVAGKTPNPHTLLNYLYARISRSEAFDLWKHARRNIIDVDDVLAIAKALIDDPTVRNTTINVANTTSYSMDEIVHAMELVAVKRAIYYPVERGAGYDIDTSFIQPMLQSAGVAFGASYLENVLKKYYTASAYGYETRS